MQRQRGELVPIGEAVWPIWAAPSRRSAKPHHRRGGASVINQDRGRVAVPSSLARGSVTRWGDGTARRRWP